MRVTRLATRNDATKGRIDERLETFRKEVLMA
jgi:hypothetical protein